MSDVKVFEFGSKRSGGQKLAGKFQIGDESFDVRVLKDSNIAFLVAGINSTTDSTVVITKVLDFMGRALTKESYLRFEKLALDPDEGLEIKDVVEVFQHVLTMVAGGDPTGDAEGSSPSPRKSGRASTGTARSAASTH